MNRRTNLLKDRYIELDNNCNVILVKVLEEVKTVHFNESLISSFQSDKFRVYYIYIQLLIANFKGFQIPIFIYVLQF